MNLRYILPLLCMIGAFVLILLALFAGNETGFMERFAIVRVDMTSFGKNLISSNSTSNQSAKNGKDNKDGKDCKDGNYYNVTDKINVTNKITDTDKTNKAGNSIAYKFGISEWYSAHILEFCEGDFKNESAGFLVLNCTTSSPGYNIDFTKILDDEITAGPANLTLTDFHWPTGIQRQIDNLNSATHAVSVLYILTAAFTGLVAFFNGVAVFRSKIPSALVVSNALFAVLAWVSLALGSIVMTAVGGATAQSIRDIGEQIGVGAVREMAFVILTWTAFGAVTVATAYWANEAWKMWKMRKTPKEAVNPEPAAVDPEPAAVYPGQAAVYPGYVAAYPGQVATYPGQAAINPEWAPVKPGSTWPGYPPK